MVSTPNLDSYHLLKRKTGILFPRLFIFMFLRVLFFIHLQSSPKSVALLRMSFAMSFRMSYRVFFPKEKLMQYSGSALTLIESLSSAT